MKWSVYTMSRWAILLALALVLGLVENILMPEGLFLLPGIKLGLSNIAILLGLCLFGFRSTLALALLRLVIILLFGGNTIAFLLALAGGITSLLFMYGLQRSRLFSLFGMSVAGAFGHTLAQLLVASLLTGSWALLYYLPFLMILSILTGLAIGGLTIPIYRATTVANRKGKVYDR